ncbi:Schwann cell myelin protein-like [Pezoporus occidentalis]|uniref:Schwann cell myelin protein-like n=1 Tax=Pezoporus occidentalis TaxID=407982 RepID=UPI002F911484
MWPFLAALPAALLLLPPGTPASPWAAWMPPSLSSLSGTCVSIPCRFGYPEELRPASIHGLWYFGSPYPKHYPPVVARSRGGPVHESFEGRAMLLGDPNRRDCSLLLGPPIGPELSGRYYFRGDLGGYNQYSFAEHADLRVLEEPTLELPPALVAGRMAEFRCRVPDNCPHLLPHISWDGTHELPDLSQRESRLDAHGDASLLALLRFRPRRHDDGRRLRCRVDFDNSSLAFQASVALDVHFPPQVLSVEGPPEALEGSAAALACVAEGRPAPLLSWFRGAALLREEPGAERLELPLPHLAPDDAGTYVCVAENRHGSHNRSLELHVASELGGSPLPFPPPASPRLLWLLASAVGLRGAPEPGGPLGALSLQEAAWGWARAMGQAEGALRACLGRRRMQLRALASLGYGARAASARALREAGGDVGQALALLQAPRLRGFRHRLWDARSHPMDFEQAEEHTLIRRALAELGLASWGRAQLFVAVGRELGLGRAPRAPRELLEAVGSCRDPEELRRRLRCECAVCGTALPREQVGTHRDP